MTEIQTDRNRWMALVVLCVGMLMIVLDSTIVQRRPASIQDDLGFSQSSLAWVVNAYLIAFGGLLRLGTSSAPDACSSSAWPLFNLASLTCGVAESKGGPEGLIYGDVPLTTFELVDTTPLSSGIVILNYATRVR